MRTDRMSGVRSWHKQCRYCGKGYTLTNFMKRQQPWHNLRDLDGKRLSDTHLIACATKAGKAANPGSMRA
jgi:hypothetical protein